jgi:non-specific protein-tyrosine kinase
LELERYFSVVKKWWWLVAASVLVAVVSSYFSVSRAPRIYQASTTLMVGQSLGKANPSTQDFYIGERLAQTYADMAVRGPVLQGAADALGLPFVPSPANVTARNIPRTELLQISVRDTDPNRARVIADAIAQQLILQSPTESVEDQNRRVFVQAQLEKLESNIQDTEAEIEDEQAKLDAANSARAIQQYQSNIAALQQKLASYRSTYASLLQTVQGGTNYISVIEPASTPGRPISPKVMETVGLAGAIGLVLAVGGVFLIEYLDDTIKTPDDVSKTVDLPTLGAIARIEGHEYPEKLVSVTHPRSSISEAYRSLRTNVQFSAIDEPIRTLMVTSPNPIEGKSVTLANLAVVMAQSGLKVIAVDTDLRRPVLHKVFGLENEYGLSSALVNPNPGVDGHIQNTQVENLRVMTSGPLPPNPAEMLGSKSMRDTIERLRAEADIVLFDSPPVLAVTDAAVLASRLDGVLLVNDSGRTRRSMAQRAVEGLRKVSANLVGVVLNRLSSASGGYSYYHYYYYSETDDGRQKRRRRRPKETVRE